MQAEQQRRHARKIARLRASKAGLMNNSKWARIFDVIVAQTGVETAKAKMLDSDKLYDMALEIYFDTVRDHTWDWIAGPLKLNEIEYIMVALPPEIDIEKLEQALRASGQYVFELNQSSLTVYGYQ